MTKEEFLQLQSDHHQSGQSLKSYLKQIGTSYTTYNYWRKKYCTPENGHNDLSPIRIRPSSCGCDPFSFDIPSGATLVFPNGLRAHFGSGSEDLLRELLYKSLMSHVLP